jgi:preprotein translocase subunit SecF
VFIKWCETIDAVESRLHEKVEIPNIKGASSRDDAIFDDRTQRILDHLHTFEYATTAHVVWTILTNTGIRLGSLRALDVEDYHPEGDPPYLDIQHRPDSDTPLKKKSDGERRIGLKPETVTVIEDQAARDPEFAAVVERNDRLGTGVPDRNVDEVYDALLDSPAEGQARGYLADDRGSARIDYTIRPGVDDSEAVADVRELAERTPLEAVPTGSLVVNEAVIDRLTESAIRSLVAAFALTAIFLALSYAYLEGKAVYGLLNLVPVLVTVGLLVGSMRLFSIPLTPINAPILSVSIGLGVDYTVHFVHRFVDEFKAGRPVDEALDVTIAGTGGALTGSMLTTVCGLGVLWLAVIPLLRDFGVLLALGVLYAYLCSILLVPSLVVVWGRYGDRVGLGLDGGLRETPGERAD